MNITFSIDQLPEVAQQILDQNPNKIILFNGEMGVGKTTLIKQLCKTLGVEEATSSPTFSIVNEYQTSRNETVFHFDFYRLKSESEALDMGVDDYLYSGHWCFIEWSEKIASLLPHNCSILSLNLSENNTRNLIFQL